MKYLYKYPQREFPYQDLVDTNAKRTREEREYNLLDTGIFDDDRYWDIFIETAKESDEEEELRFRVTAYNRGPERAPLHIVPQVFFRNTWAWGYDNKDKKPSLRQVSPIAVETKHPKLGNRYFQLSPSPGYGESKSDIDPRLMFTDNDELSGLIAKMMNADMLILLSNIDGIYTGNPESPESELIERVRQSRQTAARRETISHG